MELILDFKCVVLCIFSAHATKTYEKKDSCRESLFLDALLLSTLPNVSLQQLSRPAMPFRLMAVLHCLRTRELLVKLLRIRWLGQPMAENRDVLAKK